jgi:hypothetical protein
MPEGSINWPTVINTLIASLPAILIALGTLIVSIRTKSQVNVIDDEQKNVRERLDVREAKIDKEIEKIKNGDHK